MDRLSHRASRSATARAKITAQTHKCAGADDLPKSALPVRREKAALSSGRKPHPARGFPCFVRFPCVHAVATTAAQRLGALLRSLHPAVSALKANGITINYEQQGTGEPLVLIPYLAADHACYAFQVADYAKQFTCISLDPRGTGETDKPDGTSVEYDGANA